MFPSQWNILSRSFASSRDRSVQVTTKGSLVIQGPSKNIMLTNLQMIVVAGKGVCIAFYAPKLKYQQFLENENKPDFWRAT